MSVGGKVVEVLDCGDGAEWPGGRVWINTREPSSGRECAIFVERSAESRSVSEGDSVWWQGAHAFWTPHPRHGETPFADRKLKRIGCSGVDRPVPPQ